jgi:hypothetical protein
MSGPFSLGRIVARAGGLPRGVPALWVRSTGSRASHLARSWAWE